MDQLPGDAGDGARLQLQLPAHPQSVAAARAAIAGLRPLAETDREAVLIVVSELVTNAVRHAGLTSDRHLTLHASRLPSCVRVEVIDYGRGFDPAEVSQHEPTVEGGFGLRIVERLSERWGAHPDTGMVWAEIAAQGGTRAQQ